MRISKYLLLSFLLVSFVIPPGSTSVQAAQTRFFVDADRDFAGRSEVFATQRHTSANAYFYIENAFYNSLDADERENLKTKLSELASEFDNAIYPELRSAYGSEWKPGIDNDPRITILATSMDPGTAGYVLPRDAAPRSVEQRSNEREMIYLNTDIVLNDAAKSHLAHEFVHLIEYNQKRRKHGVVEDRWLSEALAEYAPTLLDYNSPYEDSYLEKRISDFRKVPSTSLIHWRDKPLDLATASAFIHFVVGHYGENTLSDTMQSSQTGEAALLSALDSSSFGDLFARWHTANYINGPVVDSRERYAYKNSQLTFSNLHVSNSVEYSLFPGNRITSSFRVEYAGSAWLKFVPGQLGETDTNVLKIHFDTSEKTGTFTVPLIVTHLFGAPRVEFLELEADKGTAYVENFGTDVVSVVAVPTNYYLSEETDVSSGAFTINVKLVESAPASSEPDTETEEGEVKGVTTFADGALVRAEGSDKVYVIKKPDSACPSEASCEGGTRRWIPSAEIFNGYGHLQWDDIIVTEESELKDIPVSRLVKFMGDYKVYRVNEEGTKKQWLDISPSEFEARGYNWSAIYEINRKEYNAYTTDSPVTD